VLIIVTVPCRDTGGLQQNVGQMDDDPRPLGREHSPKRNGLERNVELARDVRR
jgi:hypothetical protein